MIKSILFVVVSLAVGGFANNHLGIQQNGFYKIQSKSDNSVLTATWNGRPRQVITSDWENTATQEWKIRKLGSRGPNWVQAVIRNELVKDNELSKYFESEAGNKPNKVNREWIIEQIPSDPNAYLIKSEDGYCLVNNGKGNQITNHNICSSSNAALNQRWILEFLYE